MRKFRITTPTQTKEFELPEGKYQDAVKVALELSGGKEDIGTYKYEVVCKDGWQSLEFTPKRKKITAIIYTSIASENIKKNWRYETSTYVNDTQSEPEVFVQLTTLLIGELETQFWGEVNNALLEYCCMEFDKLTTPDEYLLRPDIIPEYKVFYFKNQKKEEMSWPYVEFEVSDSDPDMLSYEPFELPF